MVRLVLFAWLTLLLGCHDVVFEERGTAACSDGRDNDGDGMSDCRDEDCQGPPACPKSFELCKVPKDVPPAPTFGIADDRACSVEGGQLYCWGASYAGAGDLPRPERVGTGKSWVSVAVGPTHACAIDEASVLHCWGSNAQGQLGTGDATPRETPTPVAGSERFVEVAVGDAHTCALSQAQEVYCWGSNEQGQLGLGDNEPRVLPVSVEHGRGFRQVAAGPQRSCAIDSEGVLYCWGALPAPRAATTRPSVTFWSLCVTQVSTGPDFTCSVDQFEEAYCWGADDLHQLGGGPKDGKEAHLVESVYGSSVTTGDGHACLLDLKGSFSCWGDGSQGQRPGLTEGAYSTVEGAFVEVRAGGSTTCARLSDGTLSCAGDNSHGQCGSTELPATVVELTAVTFP